MRIGKGRTGVKMSAGPTRWWFGTIGCFNDEGNALRYVKWLGQFLYL